MTITYKPIFRITIFFLNLQYIPTYMFVSEVLYGFIYHFLEGILVHVVAIIKYMRCWLHVLAMKSKEFYISLAYYFANPRDCFTHVEWMNQN